MTVTASRLGSAPITIDWSNLARVSPAREPDKDAFARAWSSLKSRFAAGEVGFYNVTQDETLSQLKETSRLAEEILAKGIFTDVLFLGIGGSALGPISLLSALWERKTSRLHFHFMENPDPVDWKSMIKNLNPATTLVCAVTKSGTTFETVAQLLIALDWLGKERWPTHVVAITDPEKGDLKAFATANSIRTLHIAPSMGGRFSVFTPVGLFPAALAGLSLKELMLGAQQVRDHAEKVAVEKNPLFLLGQHFIQNYEKRPIHVCMPYSTKLRSMGDWFVQLWGESLGKDGKGFTPVAAVGATDQHSILQLLRDGPDDKITFFLTVDKVPDEVKIPRTLQGIDANRYPAFSLLQGHSLQELLMIEYRATSLVLTNRGRPHLTLHLDALDERGLGALYFTFSLLTAFTGALWGINPFDQPGVEEGKVYIRQALSEESPQTAPEDDDNSPVARLRRDRS